MPDRPDVRGRTSDGGVEFDILERLSIRGPYRCDIATHRNGYQAAHKSAGSEVYFQPDREGFVTAGLLWTPGAAVYYADGREVLRFVRARVASAPVNLTLYMGTGGWDNNHLDPQNLQLPDEFAVDYVRCWQRRDLASAADTTKIGPRKGEQAFRSIDCPNYASTQALTGPRKPLGPTPLPYHEF